MPTLETRQASALPKWVHAVLATEAGGLTVALLRSLAQARQQHKTHKYRAAPWNRPCHVSRVHSNRKGDSAPALQWDLESMLNKGKAWMTKAREDINEKYHQCHNRFRPETI